MKVLYEKKNVCPILNMFRVLEIVLFIDLNTWS